MKQWFLLSLLLTLTVLATEPAQTVEDTLLPITTVTTEEVVTTKVTDTEAQTLIADIKESSAKISFYTSVKKMLTEPITEVDIQRELQSKGITIPLAAISLEAPLITPSKKKAKAKDLARATVDLGNGAKTTIYIEVKEDLHPDKWEMAFFVIGGLAIFLLGMNYMSSGLQTIAGPRLRSMIAAVTNNRFTAVLAGAGVTTLVQSSSVTTVMVVGFVNSGIMTLRQSLGVIFGANIGTTITGWIIALKVGKYGLPVLGIAAIFYLFSRKDRVKYIAMTVMGIGMVFFGLTLMKDGFTPIKHIPEFEAMFSYFKIETLSFFQFNMYIAVGVGAVLTLLVQSSSATLGITITLAATGAINFYTAAALVMGQNIGTTITAILAALNTNKIARQAAGGHMLFNVIGVFWITALFPLYIHLIEGIFELFSGLQLFGLGDAGVEPVEAKIALVHTLFNVVNVALFVGFIPQLATLLEKIIPSDKEGPTLHITSLHQGTMFDSPSLAVEAAKFEIEQMGKLCVDIDTQMRQILSKERKDIDKKWIADVFDMEEKLDDYQKEISEYLMDLSTTHSMSHAEAERIQMLFRHADEYESISDYYANALKKGVKLMDGDIKFPQQEKSDFQEINILVGDYVQRVATAVNENTGTESEALIAEAQTVKVHIKGKRKEHLTRLQNDEMSPMFSVSYMDILSSYRQINEHLLNMAELL